MRKIVTVNNRPPIPVRNYDWCAFYDGQEEAGNYGWGATEAEAIADFRENCAAGHDERLAQFPNPKLQGEWTAHVGWAPGSMASNAETLRKYPDWCEVTGPDNLTINGHFGIEVARIIAAAPNLLIALRALRNECSGTPRPDRLIDLLARADAAIAKAEAS